LSTTSIAINFELLSARSTTWTLGCAVSKRTHAVAAAFQWICSDLVVVRLCSCVFRLDSSNLRYTSSATVTVLLHWSSGALVRRLPDCLLQHIWAGSGEGGAMGAARLRLASVLVVVARWFTDLDIIFIISVYHD
jgi:hypothetical protein